MPSLPELVADLDDEYRALLGLISALGPDDPSWDRPTPAVGWAVRDQIGHLAFFDDAGRRAVEEPEAFAREAEAALAGPGDPMAIHLDLGRSMTGDDLLEWWGSAHSAMVEALSGADPSLRLPWYGPPMGVRSFVSARLMETWAHGQDVADALAHERPATDRLRHVAHLGVRTRSFSYAVRGQDPPPGRVDVTLVGPSGLSWEWQVGGAPSSGGHGEPGVGPRERDGGSPSRIRGSALEFCLVVTQRRNVADTALVIDGPEAAEWMSIAQAFAGPPGPGRPPQGGGQ